MKVRFSDIADPTNAYQAAANKKALNLWMQMEPKSIPKDVAKDFFKAVTVEQDLIKARSLGGGLAKLLESRGPSVFNKALREIKDVIRLMAKAKGFKVIQFVCIK